jgi:CRAL/TRIO domain
MSHFTMANMDYTPVKFMIKIFEANYPESLGAVLVHKSPWLFQGIWKIIKGWLDPVVAAKVHFTGSVEDLEEFIPRKQIIKELGGEEDWEYKFIEPVEGEDEMMKDHETKQKLLDERNGDVQEYQKKTFEWISSEDGQKVKEQRDELARKLNENYWRLDPYVRARTLYDRVGMIEKGGKINFYPVHNKPAGSDQAVEAETNADDVD